MPWRVLIAAVDADCRSTLYDILKVWGLQLLSVSTIREACQVLREEVIGLVFCEDELADGGFRDLLAETASFKPPPRLIALIHGEEKYNEALQLGAMDAVPLPCRRSDLQWVLIRAMSHIGKAPKSA